MERLTLRDPDGAAYIKSSVTRHEAADRLAAYENTGLEPEEIQAIAGLASENCAKTADAIVKLLQDDAELKSYRELGPIDRLRELAQADREGRCMVLPKDGMVYYIEEAGGEKWIGNKPIQQVIL